MILNKFRKIALGLAVIMSVGLATPAYAKSEFNEGDILALGSDLTKAQEEEIRKFLDAPDGTKTIYVTDEIIIEQLGLDPNDPANYAGGCYSSAYVKLTDDNKGIKVDARNLTEVTASMLMNALITSGVTSARVKVTAPFKVTGTSALSGILAGVEDVGGYEISLKQKETAQKEIETTIDIGEEVGQEEASTIINDVKTEIIKENPKSDEEIEKIVNNVTDGYDIKISDESKEQLVGLMKEVNDLDIDYSEVKNALEKAGDTLKDNLKELGVKLKDEGFFEKIGNWFKDLWNKFLALFEKDDTEEKEEPKDSLETNNEQEATEEEQSSEEIVNPEDTTTTPSTEKENDEVKQDEVTDNEKPVDTVDDNTQNNSTDKPTDTE